MIQPLGACIFRARRVTYLTYTIFADLVFVSRLRMESQELNVELLHRLFRCRREALSSLTHTPVPTWFLRPRGPQSARGRGSH